MSIAGPNDIGFFLSGGTTNTNPHLSRGGAISNSKIHPKTFNNLWSDISERQARYGHKDIRIIYLKNLHPTLTFKNMRVYWNETDNFTFMQIGRAAINSPENSTLSLASIGVSDNAIPPSLWNSVIAVDTFRTVQDFNDLNVVTAYGLGEGLAETKLGVHVDDSSSTMSNRRIARFSVLLRRFGPAHGPVNCKVWDESGNVKASIGSIDSATIPTTEGAGFIGVFTNQSNQYAMRAGDIIGLEYPGSGSDEGGGSDDDYISWGVWVWTGSNSNTPSGNISKNIQGTTAWAFHEGDWRSTDTGKSEFIYKAETFGPEGGGGPCDPDPGPGPNPPPDSGFILMYDFTDVNAQTAYQVGSGAPNNITRQAVSIDATTAPILSHPIARITFLMKTVGLPAGTVSCRIWSPNGAVMATMGQFEASALTEAGQGTFNRVAFALQTNTYQLKIGDFIGIEFVTGNAQDHILVAGWTWQSTAAAAAEGEAGQPAAASDKFGVRYIYPNTGNFKYAADWEIPGSSSSMRWDFPNPPLNAEMTCYFQKSSPSSDTISCKIRGGKHTDSAKNDGCCYILQFPTTGGTMEFQIECPHPNNHDCPTSGIDGTALSMATWHGYKCAWWNVGTTVHMEAWQDKGDNSGSTPTNQWEKIQVHDDSSGNCGSISNPLLKPKGNTSQVTFRIDENSGTAYKWLSIVEVQPGGEVPGPGPSEPPGAKDTPGTSIKRWNGSVWTTNDGGMSDLVFKAERFATIPGEPGPKEDPIIIDPGTKRKPTTYDQGIVFPPLGPNDYKALILERVVPPDPDEIGQADVESQIVAEIDVTTEVHQPTDPGNPPPPQPPPTNPPPTPPPPSPGQIGPYASTGKQLSASTRRAVRHYASGKPDDETIEKNTKSIPYNHYQCVYFVTMHDVEHDDTVSVKYGGTHMGTGWFDHGITFNAGKTCLGKEEDHPNTDLCVITGPSYGSILEKRIGIAGIYRKPTNFCELWIKMPGAAWVKAIESGNIGGFNPGADEDEAQLRIDGFTDGDDPTIDTAIVQEISG